MDTLYKVERFFTDKTFQNEVGLTQEEAKILSDFEVKEAYYSGLANISGGFACITLEEFDEENKEILLGAIKTGVQNDCENNVYSDRIIFNREKMSIRFE